MHIYIQQHELAQLPAPCCTPRDVGRCISREEHPCPQLHHHLSLEVTGCLSALNWPKLARRNLTLLLSYTPEYSPQPPLPPPAQQVPLILLRSWIQTRKYSWLRCSWLWMLFHFDIWQFQGRTISPSMSSPPPPPIRHAFKLGLKLELASLEM